MKENCTDLKALAFYFLTSLKTCIRNKDFHRGAILHAETLKCGLFEEIFSLQNIVISMYAKCGALMDAHKVLCNLPVRGVVSWSALISGYAQNGQGKDALDCYEAMQRDGLSPDAITYTSILKACGLTQEAERGNEIHNEIVQQGLLGENVVLGSALVDMYAKCGLLTRAQQVHDELHIRTVISWNTLISGYTQMGKGVEALSCFECMQKEGVSPNAITYTCILKVCGMTRATSMGKKIHDEIVSQRLLGKDVVLGTALVDMYAKCGLFVKAREVLNNLLDRNTITWNALIAGYTQSGQSREAFDCLRCMRREGLHPNAVTYACILKACSIIGEAEMGEKIYNEIDGQGLLRGDIVLGIALVDMYAKFGMLTKAEQVLGKLHVRDIVIWNALITGYTEQGQSKEALDCFDRMQRENVLPNIITWNALIGGYAQQGLVDKALGCFHLMQCKGVSPDAITFVCLLNACSHAGLLVEGQILCHIMRDNYVLAPVIEHYTCIIDLFGRAGDFEMVMAVINTLPTLDHPQVWAALLGPCQKWGNKRLGELAFDYAILFDECDVEAYVRMENIYIAAGIQEDAHQISSQWADGCGWECSELQCKENDKEMI